MIAAEPDHDLFGEEIKPRELPVQPGAVKKRKPTKPNGYAGIPGSGPEGKTCRTCKNCVRTGNRGKFLKCLLLKHAWTHGPGTDIKARTPACSKFEADETH